MQVFFEFLDFGVVGGLGSGWAKLNVVFLCRQVRWQNTSFNFAKRWQFLFSVSLLSVVSVFYGVYIFYV